MKINIYTILIIIVIIIVIFLFAIYYFYPEQDFVRLFPVDPVTRIVDSPISPNGTSTINGNMNDTSNGANGRINGVQDAPMNGGMGEVTNGESQNEPEIAPPLQAPSPPESQLPTYYEDCPGLYYSPDYRYIGGVSTFGDGRYLPMTAADRSNLQTAMNRCNADPNCVAIDTSAGYFLRSYDVNRQRANPQNNPCLGIFSKV